MRKIHIDIIIPAFNEESVIAPTIRDCLALSSYRTHVIVFVDGKTSDKTATVAKAAGATVVKTHVKSGKGALIRLALRHLSSDFVVQIDADHQFQPQEIPKLLEPLRKGYDITLATRYQRGSLVEMYSVSFLRLFGSAFLSRITSFFANQKVTDVMAGFKAFKREILLDLSPQTDHFGYEAELVIKAAQKEYRIKNVPITYTARAGGRSSVSSLKHGFLVLATIIKYGLTKKN